MDSHSKLNDFNGLESDQIALMVGELVYIDTGVPLTRGPDPKIQKEDSKLRILSLIVFILKHGTLSECSPPSYDLHGMYSVYRVRIT